MLKDGGQIALDWEDISQTSFNHPSTPVLLIMPGLTGMYVHVSVYTYVFQEACMGRQFTHPQDSFTPSDVSATLAAFISK